MPRSATRVLASPEPVRASVVRVPASVLALGVAFAVLAGCSGSDTSSTIVTGKPPTSPPATAPATAPPTAPGTTASTKPTVTDGSALTTVGLDKVTFGMTVEDAQAAAGTKLVPVDANTRNPSCYLARPEAGAGDVTYLVSDGRIERVDVAGGNIATRSGARIGSTEAEVKGLYPDQIEVQARPDGQPGNALVFVPKDPNDAKFRIVFLTDGTAVTAMRAGRLPQVLAATGCR